MGVSDAVTLGEKDTRRPNKNAPKEAATALELRRLQIVADGMEASVDSLVVSFS